MKGVIIEQPFEVRLEISGEDFHQGQTLPCTLTVKNHSVEPQSLEGAHLQLAVGDLKKVKQRDPAAFEVLARADLSPSAPLPPKEQQSFLWGFTLDKNCPISDKGQSPFLLYGVTAQTNPEGQLPVTVKVHPHIQAIIELVESTFQFVYKDTKSADGWVDVKFKPSSDRRFTMVEELRLGFRFDGDALLLRYSFKVKKFEASESSLGISKGKSSSEQRLDAREYLLTDQFINPEVVEGRIEEALKAVAV